MDTKKLRQKILDLAIHGKLVPQDPNNEPASVLLERIRAEKERLIAEGKIKRSKKSATSDTSHYENVPFELPEGWCWAPLNSACTIFGRIGFRGYTKDDLVDSTGAITLSPSNIVDGVMNYEKCTYISWEKYEESPEIQVQNEDILLVKTGSSYGKCAYVESLPKEATINPQFVVLKFIGCNPRFLTYCLQSNYARKQYEEFVLGTAILTFTQVALGAMAIPMPPIEEQERIVAEAEKLFSFVDSLDENTNELGNVITVAKSKILDLAIHGKLVSQNPNDEAASELLKRINPKAVASCDNPQYGKVPSSWVIATVGEIFTINPKTHVEDDTEAAFVPMTCVADGYSNTFEYECRKWGDIKKGFVHFQENDVAVAKISPCLENRKSVVFHDLPNGIGAGTTELNVFRCGEILPEYALFYFKSQMFIGSCAGTYNGVVGQQRVAKSFIQELPIGIPPYKEQLRIVSKVNDLFSQLDLIEKSLQA